jgi:hypothetical protein
MFYDEDTYDCQKINFLNENNHSPAGYKVIHQYDHSVDVHINHVAHQRK